MQTSAVNHTPAFPLSPTVDDLVSLASDPTTLRRILNNCEADGSCLIWKGGTSTRGGYPYMGNSRYAHREAYKAFRGDLEDGSILHESHSVELHHRCNSGGDKTKRRCCNPLHLEPVTRNHHNRIHSGVN